MPTSRLALLACATAFSVPGALAQESNPTPLEPIVVSPNRTPTEKAKTGSTVDVIDTETIERESRATIVDYLNRVPGLNISPSGGIGQETSLTLRGADKKYVKTLFNGIDISDPTAPQVQTSIEHLLTDGVDRIEVLKGSQGTLYGADAVAGVISLSTLSDPEDGLRVRMGAEAGSFGTVRSSLNVTNVTGGTRFGASFGGLRTDGISAADIAGAERDAYRNINGNFALEQAVNETFSVFAYGLFIDSKADFDDGGLPPRDNRDNLSDARTLAGRAGFNLDLADGRFKNTVSFQAYKVDRSLYTTTFGPFLIDYEGVRNKVDYQGSFEVNDRLTVMAGADYETRDLLIENAFSTTDAGDDIAGVWTQVLVEPIDNLALSAGVRHDSHSEFGGYTTWRATGAYTLDGTGTTFRSSVGTGFRSPSPYELNYVSFNPAIALPDLKPEESFSFDIGVEQRLFNERLTLGATWFMLDTDNLIDYDFGNDTYIQLPGTTERNGVELAAAFAATDWLTLTAAYTYTSSVQEDGERRPRVPENVVQFGVVAQPWERWTISTDAKIAMDAVDIVSPAFGVFQRVPLDDYAVLGAKVGYKPTETSEIYVRAENLLNDDYQVVKGYGTPGFAVFGGVKAEF